MKNRLQRVYIFIFTMVLIFSSVSMAFAYHDGIVNTEFFEKNNPNNYVLTMEDVSVKIDNSITKKASTVMKRANVTIDNVPVNFTNDFGYPYVDENGRTQVPLRAVMETFGCKVTWHGAVNQRIVVLEKGEEIVMVPIERKLLLVSRWENATKTDTVAIIKDGKTYVPIRRILEFFGAKVDWDKETNTVIVNSKPTSKIIKEGMNLTDVISAEMAKKIEYQDFSNGYKVLDNGYDYKVNFIVCYDHINGKMTRLAYANMGGAYLIDRNGNILDFEGGPLFQSSEMTSHNFNCNFSDAKYLAFDYDGTGKYDNTLILIPTSSIK